MKGFERRSARGATVVAALVCLGAGNPPQAAPGAQTAGSPDAAAVVNRFCVSCHSERTATGGVAIEGLDLTDVAPEAPVWERVIRKLRTRSMPPWGAPRPDEAGYQTLMGYLERSLDEAAARNPNPVRAPIHRLNRAEYANAVRDLLGVEVDPSALLPPDDAIDGFDNNAAALSLSPVLLERYLSAAARVSALAVGSPTIEATSETYRVRGDGSQTRHLDGLPLGTRGGVRADHWFPLDGEYVFKVKLLETNLGSLRGLIYQNQLEISIDGERVLLAPVGGVQDFVASPANARNVVESVEARLTARVPVRAGPRTVVAAFLEKTAAQMPDRLQAFERSTLIATDYLGLPHVESLTILGPFEAAPPADTPSRRRIFVCYPDQAEPARPCAERLIERLARRAYRRPVTADDVDPLLAFYEQGARAGGFEAGITGAIRALLVSPKFLFRAEQDPPGVAAGVAYPIDDLALASRLSFFLWSSIPDDELLELAIAGRLGERAELERQVRRMLADQRARSLVDNFAGQWLQLRNLRATEPDKNLFPDFDDNLRRAFGREAELFVESLIAEDRSVLDLLTARDTFVNERLARHYGIPHVYGSRFRRVSPQDEARAGLLGKGAILLITSHPDRTSPVVRGKWVLENLLGSPPPPPPAAVPPLEEAEVGADATMRERMVAHRRNPVCASCHQIMDPIGLALEHFDAVGKWRDREGGRPIDASGRLTDGTEIDGAAALREALLARPEVFVTTVTEKLLTYALGRRVEAADMPAVRGIVRRAAADDYRFSALVLGIVESVPFRLRRQGG
jgi:mono/diheme cytochrome c family protein